MRTAVLQLSSQGMSSTKLYNYVRIANKKGVKLLLLGEYILNPFFKELENMSVSMIDESAKHHIKVLKELSKTYELTIIAPLVIVKKKKLYKTVVKFAPNSTSYYQQQILINYPHWNEENFFDNEKKELQTPHIFKIDKFRFAIVSGFEIHFDKIFEHIQSKKVDCILVPSVSTFESYERWKSILTTRAFTNNCYILRANRIGEYKDKEFNWGFYGDSLLISPNGEVLSHLGESEELMIVDMNKKDVTLSKKLWKFYDTIKTRV